MELTELVQSVPSFESSSHPEKIKLFAWYLHTHRKAERVTAASIRGCYDEIHAVAPDLSVYLPRLASKKPPELLRDARGYRLEGRLRRALDEKHGVHPVTVAVTKLLSQLPTQIPDLAERAFLSEAVNCYRVLAFRATIVMTWNLAFDHLLNWILADAVRQSDFNAAIAKVYPKKAGIAVNSLEEFEQLKESEIIEIAGSAKLFSKDVKKILKEKLDKRNTAAHPSLVEVTEAQANDVIVDLVKNVVLKLV